MWIFSRRLRRLRREECSKLHYPAEKYRLFEVKAVLLFYCFGVCLRKSARSAGDIGVLSVCKDWVLLREYSLADYAEHAERNAASCIISQRKTGWVGCEIHSVIVVFVVLGLVCDYLRETLGFYLCVKIEYSYVNILPQILQRRMQLSCIISQRND